MRLFLLYKSRSPHDKSKTLLEAACQKKGIECIPIAIEDFDFTQDNPLRAGDALYRIADGKKAQSVERFLLLDDTATFYQKNANAYFFPDDLALYKKYNLATPKTIPALSRDKAVLEKSALAVGGFPLILKILGKSHGVGIIRVDSLPSLYSLVDALDTKHTVVAMKEYIPHTGHARLIVIGDKVVDSIRYIPQGSDFRTNVGKDIVVKPEKFSEAIEELAVEAVRVSGWEFGGVDILLGDDPKDFYLAEVNFPCFFPRAQEVSGVDIATQMVEYLGQKSRASVQ